MLLEALVSLAVFIGAAAAALAASRNAAQSLDRSQRFAEAVDVARTLMSQLEAGIITMADVRAGISIHGRTLASTDTDDVGLTVDDLDADGDIAPPIPSSGPATQSAAQRDTAPPSVVGRAWRVEARTRPTEYQGLVLVELDVVEDTNAVDAEHFTLRQLMRLRDAQ